MDVRIQVRAGLQSQGLPAPTLAWIQSVLPNRNPLPPLPALVASARSRLLTADLTSPALLEAPAPALPASLVGGGGGGGGGTAAGAGAVHVREARLPHDVLVQVLDVENLCRSKWEQVEELEAIARGEQTRGREIIRLPTTTSNEADDGDGEGASLDNSTTGGGGSNRPGGSGGGASLANNGNSNTGGNTAAAAAPKNSTHRLVLQDCRGQRIHGLELRRVDRVGVATLHVGEKILLRRGAAVARGVVLLEPDTCAVLGGRVEAWQRPWVEGRLARLREAVGGGDADGRR